MLIENLKNLIIKRIKRGKYPNITPERIDALDTDNKFPSTWKYHHIYRYNLAKQYCKNKIVLDVGCGYGYGTFILSKVCKQIIGIDISNEAINVARKKYLSKNNKFLIMNSEELKLNQTFDVIVSFENIEHLDNPDKFLSQAKKLFKKDGILIVSTPNAKYTSGDNPYHKKEFSFQEFKELIKKYFTIQKIEGEYLMPIFSWKIFSILWHILETIFPKITLIPCYLGKKFPAKSFTLIAICLNHK